MIGRFVAGEGEAGGPSTTSPGGPSVKTVRVRAHRWSMASMPFSRSVILPDVSDACSTAACRTKSSGLRREWHRRIPSQPTTTGGGKGGDGIDAGKWHRVARVAGAAPRPPHPTPHDDSK